MMIRRSHIIESHNFIEKLENFFSYNLSFSKWKTIPMFQDFLESFTSKPFEMDILV
jgi:hypothetical protein